jgi:septal ring factor EnvC (AmiA/AmiB activator)
MITFLRSIFSWQMLAVLVGGALIATTVWYGLQLQDRLATAEQEYLQIKKELVETEEQAATNLAGYQTDIQAYESSIRSIRRSLQKAQVSRTRLEQTLDEAEANDTSLQECLSTPLPSSVLDSLY